MGVLHRALLTWFLGLVFLILLVIRLDQRTNWSWFIVFIPMWIFDAVVLTHSVFTIVRRCKNEFLRQICSAFVIRKIYVLVTVLLKLTAQILLCLKLSSWNIPLYCVFIPVWIVLAVGLVRIGYALGLMNAMGTLEQFRIECLRREGVVA